LFGAGGEFDGRRQNCGDKLSGVTAAAVFQRDLEPRLAEDLAARIERLGNPVAEQEQRVPGASTVSATR